MRVIAGIFKGRKLKFPKCREVRPITDRIKESLFGILVTDILDADVLDLFAGSGSIGIEALSRGAKSVTFVEKNQQVINVLKSNLEELHITEFCRVIKDDAVKAVEFFGRKNSKFSAIFVDSPYIYNTVEVLNSIAGHNILSKNGILISRNFWREQIPENIGTLRLFRKEHYGDGVLLFFKNCQL